MSRMMILDPHAASSSHFTDFTQNATRGYVDDALSDALCDYLHAGAWRAVFEPGLAFDENQQEIDVADVARYALWRGKYTGPDKDNLSISIDHAAFVVMIRQAQALLGGKVEVPRSTKENPDLGRQVFHAAVLKRFAPLDDRETNIVLSQLDDNNEVAQSERVVVRCHASDSFVLAFIHAGLGIFTRAYDAASSRAQRSLQDRIKTLYQFLKCYVDRYSSNPLLEMLTKYEVLIQSFSLSMDVDSIQSVCEEIRQALRIQYEEQYHDMAYDEEKYSEVKAMSAAFLFEKGFGITPTLCNDFDASKSHMPIFCYEFFTPAVIAAVNKARYHREVRMTFYGDTLSLDQARVDWLDRKGSVRVSMSASGAPSSFFAQTLSDYNLALNINAIPSGIRRLIDHLVSEFGHLQSVSLSRLLVYAAEQAGAMRKCGHRLAVYQDRRLLVSSILNQVLGTGVSFFIDPLQTPQSACLWVSFCRDSAIWQKALRIPLGFDCFLNADALLLNCCQELLNNDDAIELAVVRIFMAKLFHSVDALSAETFRFISDEVIAALRSDARVLRWSNNQLLFGGFDLASGDDLRLLLAEMLCIDIDFLLQREAIIARVDAAEPSRNTQQDIQQQLIADLTHAPDSIAVKTMLHRTLHDLAKVREPGCRMPLFADFFATSAVCELDVAIRDIVAQHFPGESLAKVVCNNDPYADEYAGLLMTRF